MKIFNQDDFFDSQHRDDGLIRVFVAVKQANDKINDLIEESPVVYGDVADGFFATVPKGKDDTHKARLMFIESIVKEPCKHEPIFSKTTLSLTADRQGNEYPFSKSKCGHCGVELVATWSEKK